jgi:hypothetical protein
MLVVAGHALQKAVFGETSKRDIVKKLHVCVERVAAAPEPARVSSYRSFPTLADPQNQCESREDTQFAGDGARCNRWFL